jgi:nucleolar protein 58
MGSDVTDQDETCIKNLAAQILELQEYKEQLGEYLKSRMQAIAPNTSFLIGEPLAAKLIAKAGSLLNLAKYPASTVQLLGAEKALFKAMRSKTDTPKYGLLYQASLVGQVSAPLKGKVCRTLAAKCALCIRTDALKESDESENVIGINSKTYLEKRIRYLESNAGKTAGGAKARPGFQKDFTGQKRGRYNASSDFTLGQGRSAPDDVAALESTFVRSKQTRV